MAPTLFPLMLADQIASVEREIVMRMRVYPRRVSDGKMTKDKADHELACMRAVLETLKMLDGPVARLKGAKPLVLYFANDEDRADLAEIIKAAKPSMVEVKLP